MRQADQALRIYFVNFLKRTDWHPWGWMPKALDRKYPHAGKEVAWFWVFPSQTLSTDPRVGIVRRHHMSDSVVQKAVKVAAAAARIHKPVSVHTLRHYAGSWTMPSDGRFVFESGRNCA